MPFFPAINQYYNKRKKYIANKKQPLRKSATLQVRPLLAGLFIRSRGKRVWPSSLNMIEEWKDIKKIEASGSMAVEAAMAMSIFLFAAVCMAAPFKMMDRQRQILAAAEAVCKKYSQYAYLGENMAGAAVGTAVLGSAEIKKNINLNGIRNLSFWGSSVLEDGEMIDFTLNYEMELPFSFLGLKAIPMEVRSVRRAWIGNPGILGEGQESQLPDEGLEGETVVYIGRNSTRYHRTRSCHYLSNELQTVLYDNLENYRSADGSRYRPCHICGKKAGKGSTVYIMPSGESYHTDWSCPATISYVEEVLLPQVEHLGKCSYCW